MSLHRAHSHSNADSEASAPRTHLSPTSTYAPSPHSQSRQSPQQRNSPHQQQQQQQPADGTSPPSFSMTGDYGTMLYKTELCRSFSEVAYCRYGLKCRFAHGQAELRPVSRHKKYKTEVCKNFAREGTCPYGVRCRFIHTFDDETSNLNISSLSISKESTRATSSAVLVPQPAAALHHSPLNLSSSLPQYSSKVKSIDFEDDLINSQHPDGQSLFGADENLNDYDYDIDNYGQQDLNYDNQDYNHNSQPGYYTSGGNDDLNENEQNGQSLLRIDDTRRSGTSIFAQTEPLSSEISNLSRPKSNELYVPSTRYSTLLSTLNSDFNEQGTNVSPFQSNVPPTSFTPSQSPLDVESALANDNARLTAMSSAHSFLTPSPSPVASPDPGADINSSTAHLRLSKLPNATYSMNYKISSIASPHDAVVSPTQQWSPSTHSWTMHSHTSTTPIAAGNSIGMKPSSPFVHSLNSQFSSPAVPFSPFTTSHPIMEAPSFDLNSTSVKPKISASNEYIVLNSKVPSSPYSFFPQHSDHLNERAFSLSQSPYIHSDTSSMRPYDTSDCEDNLTVHTTDTSPSLSSVSSASSQSSPPLSSSLSTAQSTVIASMSIAIVPQITPSYV